MYLFQNITHHVLDLKPNMAILRGGGGLCILLTRNNPKIHQNWVITDYSSGFLDNLDMYPTKTLRNFILQKYIQQRQKTAWTTEYWKATLRIGPFSELHLFTRLTH